MPLTEIKIDPQSPSTFPHMNQLSTLNTNLPHKMQIRKVGFWGIKNQKQPKPKRKKQKQPLQIRSKELLKSQFGPKTRSRPGMNMLPERQCHSVSNENPEVKPLYLVVLCINFIRKKREKKKKNSFFSLSQQCIIVGQWIQTMPTESDLAPTDTTHYQVYYHLHQTPQFKIITINIHKVLYIYVCTCKQSHKNKGPFIFF